MLALALSLLAAPAARAQVCTGDIVPDGRIDGGDLGTLLSNWGPVVVTNPVSQACDLDRSGGVDGFDLSLLLGNWGWCTPAVSGVSPSEGCIVGGTTITITGAYLGATSAVTVGGVPATGVTVLSQSAVTAVTPAGTSGPATVSVATPAGTVTAPQPFTYMPASVLSIVPNAGVLTGGSQITITGGYLTLTTGVTVGGAPCTNVTVVNASTVTAITPPGSLGIADVVVTGGKGTITVPGGFRYAPIVVPSWATLIEMVPDPAVVTDPALRAAIVASGRPWRVRDTATQMEMLLIPAGTFQMGCIMPSDLHPCTVAQLPVHQVTLSRPFYLGRYEVTQAQWQATMGSNPSSFQSQPDSPSCPVENVSWNTVQGYLGANGMRLPTEAEWEFACRAGTQTPFHNGSTDDATVVSLGWVLGNAAGRTHAVGGKAANGYGLHDLYGNVMELVFDRLSTYPSDPQTDPVVSQRGTLVTRIVRGGSWFGPESLASSSQRFVVVPSEGVNYVGFRAAKQPFDLPAWATLVEVMPDPAVVTDPALRAAIIATGRPWRIRDTATQVEMLLVPPGTFQMGCIEGSDQFGCTPAEQPVHHVTLPHAFYMSRHELTQAQWMATMGSNPSMFQGQADSASRPVEQVSWNAIQAYLGATGMRLPTEAEWEYACRAGTQTPFHNGSTDDATLGALAWYGSCCGGNSGERTHAVGGKAANALGFHDMLGNVWEWVNDGYGPYPAEPQTNPAGAAGAATRVVRGGSFFDGSGSVRASYRLGLEPLNFVPSVGFRVVRTP